MLPVGYGLKPYLKMDRDPMEGGELDPTSSAGGPTTNSSMSEEADTDSQPSASVSDKAGTSQEAWPEVEDDRYSTHINSASHHEGSVYHSHLLQLCHTFDREQRQCYHMPVKYSLSPQAVYSCKH